MIERAVKSRLVEYLTYYPVVVLTGPRQSGKTTLLRDSFPEREYFNLENPSTLELVKADPEAFLDLHGSNVIIDEAQRFPELFSYIQASVDDHRVEGRIILSGSQNVLLTEAISQTLAGRAAYLELLPLTQSELKAAGYATSDPGLQNLYQGLFSGAYPGQRVLGIPPELFFDQYIATFVERDVRTIKNISNLASFQSFIRILAGRIGQLLDYSSIANDVGVSPNTVKSWLSLLEASYLVKLLKPLHNNYGKRYIKSPKVYFIDTGLACRLLGIRQAREIEVHYLRGYLFENYVVAELHKQISSRNLGLDMFYYRDAKQNEVDLILQGNSGETAVEIKSASSFTPSMLKGLDFWQKTRLNNPTDAVLPANSYRFLVYTGKADSVGSVGLLPWHSLERLLG